MTLPCLLQVLHAIATLYVTIGTDGYMLKLLSAFIGVCINEVFILTAPV